MGKYKLNPFTGKLDIDTTSKEDKGTLTGLVSRNVVITYKNTYTTPLVTRLNVYRVDTAGADNIETGVVIINVNKSLPTQLSFDIHPSESLTGVIVEYKVEEAG